VVGGIKNNTRWGWWDGERRKTFVQFRFRVPRVEITLNVVESNVNVDLGVGVDVDVIFTGEGGGGAGAPVVAVSGEVTFRSLLVVAESSFLDFWGKIEMLYCFGSTCQ